jgi:ABC-type multidrug transport system ATPase subunit
MSILSVDRVSKRYSTNQVLRTVSLELNKSTVLALLGQSGCGKTTLARLICGLLIPDVGKILVAGHEVRGLDLKQHVSYMPQDSGIWATLTVKRQLALVLQSKRARFSGAGGIEQLARLGSLETCLSSNIDKLSGGELRRLGFLRSIAISCDLMI